MKTSWWSLGLALVALALAGCGDDPPTTPPGVVCGDDTCDASESCTSCATDCGACAPSCGDDTCDASESCTSCATDCGACVPVCDGDGTCEGGETCGTCAADCGACDPVCGDEACNGAETCLDCPGDCGACPAECGDGTCEGGETCGACATDCGACPPVCGDGSCTGAEDCTACPGDCGACVGTCGDGTCDPSDTCGNCEADCGPCGPSCGDGTCDAGEDCEGCETDCGACDPTCGDLVCEPGYETCGSCSGDCGACSWCGDAVCDSEGGETCGTCATDCGACNVCGDGSCEGGETCGTCATDCGACNVCGDGACEGGETCGTCATDCGACQTSDYSEWLDAYAALTCERFETCQGVPLTAFDMARCRLEVREEYLVEVPLELVESGHVTFDAQWAERLLDALAAWPACSIESAGQAWEHLDVLFRGSLQEDEPCGAEDEWFELCAVGLRCDRSADDGSPCTGTCQPIAGVAIGGQCRVSADCAMPAANHLVWCADHDEDGVRTCVDIAPQVQADPGGACSSWDEDDPAATLCPPGHYCSDPDWDGAGTCMPIAEVGEECFDDSSWECAGWYVSCVPDDETWDTFHCRQDTLVVAEGAPCDDGTVYDAGERYCDWSLNLTCDYDTETCVLQGDGSEWAACNISSNCDPGLLCRYSEDFDEGVCLTALDDGESCSEDDGCLSGYCDPGSLECAPMPLALDPGGDEVCDGEDNDCDGATDEGFDPLPHYFDWDGDGYGDPYDSVVMCTAGPDWVTDNTDCADWDETSHPGAVEVCDYNDNDCDGAFDEGVEPTLLYADWDEDGYGDPDESAVMCASEFWVANNTDCYPWDGAIHPGADEVCDGFDNDCDNVIDDSCSD